MRLKLFFAINDIYRLSFYVLFRHHHVGLSHSDVCKHGNLLEYNPRCRICFSCWCRDCASHARVGLFAGFGRRADRRSGSVDRGTRTRPVDWAFHYRSRGVAGRVSWRRISRGDPIARRAHETANGTRACRRSAAASRAGISHRASHAQMTIETNASNSARWLITGPCPDRVSANVSCGGASA